MRIKLSGVGQTRGLHRYCQQTRDQAAAFTAASRQSRCPSPAVSSHQAYSTPRVCLGVSVLRVYRNICRGWCKGGGIFVQSPDVSYHTSTTQQPTL